MSLVFLSLILTQRADCSCQRPCHSLPPLAIFSEITFLIIHLLMVIFKCIVRRDVALKGLFVLLGRVPGDIWGFISPPLLERTSFRVILLSI